MSELVDALNTAEIDESEVVAEKDYSATKAVSAANMFSEEWTDYVLKLFSDDEMDNGHPKCEGLRRIVNLLVGYSTSTIISNAPPTFENFGNATVAVRVQVHVTNEDHPMYGKVLTQDAVTDVNSRNTPAPFHMHPSASSFTRSEASAFRKILHLKNTVSAEELAPENAGNDEPIWESDEVIGDEQIMAIDAVSRRCNLSVLEYINSGSSGAKYEFIEQIRKSTALSMIKHLNKIQQGKCARPKTVGNYNPSWKTENNKKRGIEL